MAARELRYDWFEVIRQQQDAEAIAVAHHRDDSVETLLLNLIRGTGIKGLTGISPKRGHVVRPLLCVTRSEIEQYMNERGLPAVFDSSNSDEQILRNAVRLRLIPLLEELNPSVREAIHRTSQHLAEAAKVYNDAISQQSAALLHDGRIDIEALKRCPSPASLLFEILTPLGFNPSVIGDIAESLNATPGKLFLGENYRVIKDRDALLIAPLPDEEEQPSYLIEQWTTTLKKPLNMQIRLLDMPATIEKKRSILTVDLDLLQFPLLLRRWQQGDWFIPFGMKGKKKLSDYFTDRKMSLLDKEEVWVLLSGEDLVWVVGERPDDRFRVTDKTRKLFQIRLDSEKA
jgi:tRNA(Ile)-lysidine synthase